MWSKTGVGKQLIRPEQADARKSKRNKRIYPDTRKPHAKKRLPGGLATDLEGVPVAVGVFEVLRRADAFKAAARHDG